jgi:hypothetical protein
VYGKGEGEDDGLDADAPSLADIVVVRDRDVACYV